MSDGPRVPQPAISGMTPAQQRRANALILVRFLWPVIDSAEAVRRATWIINGYGTVDPPDRG